jgi:hypothetical protein
MPAVKFFGVEFERGVRWVEKLHMDDFTVGTCPDCAHKLVARYRLQSHLAIDVKSAASAHTGAKHRLMNHFGLMSISGAPH